MPVLTMSRAMSASLVLHALEQEMQGGEIGCCVLLDVGHKILDHHQAPFAMERELY